MQPSVRPATLADAEAIREIYNYYVLNSTCTFQVEPDTPEQRRDWLTNRGTQHPVIVAEAEGQVIGWGALSAWKSREAYARTVEASVYIRQGSIRRGLGRLLLQELIDRARQLGHHALIGGACTEHPNSLALQATLGMQPIGLFRQVGYKFDRWLDVAYTQLILNPE